MNAAEFAARHWYRTTALSVCLLPLAGIFGALSVLRRCAYASGLVKQRRVAVPVIVIGNLVAGGTGKTPLVLWIAGLLGQQGYRPGIVLRGYGGATTAPHEVRAGDAPSESGDEAVLLAAKSGVPAWSGADRAAAAMQLLAQHPECDVILADDGLQHYGLARDIEIAVEDGRGHGNGFLLPAGPLREPGTRRVDATVVNAGSDLAADEQPGHPVRMDRAATRRSAAGEVFRMRLVPSGWATPEGVAVDRAVLAGKRLHAVAGIGNPQRFFGTLRSLGLTVTEHAFPDHHAYTSADLDFPCCDLVLMTEKDAVKCRLFQRDDLVVLGVRAELEPRFADFLLNALHGLSTA